MTHDSRFRPILKWPGGKYRLLDAILPALPPGKRLVEPFVGSGAVFLNAAYPSFLLCDINPDLIGFYRSLAERDADFIRECRALFDSEGNERTEYCRRRERFNSLAPGADRAALFLYLNRHGYNGLIRYNAGGGFNVPFGRYVRPYFPEAEMRAFLDKFRRTETTFRAVDFREAFRQVKKGDVLYCDPPYIPLSPTANFTSYAGNRFGPADQKDVAALVAAAAARGVPAVVSNHDVDAARELYRNADSLLTLPVRRCISRNGAGRVLVGELLAVYRPARSSRR